MSCLHVWGFFIARRGSATKTQYCALCDEFRDVPVDTPDADRSPPLGIVTSGGTSPAPSSEHESTLAVTSEQSSSDADAEVGQNPRQDVSRAAGRERLHPSVAKARLELLGAAVAVGVAR